MKYAPVLIPTLCRDDKFIRCMESLRRNSWADRTEIYIGVDYPTKESHWQGYRRICTYLERDFPEFAAVHVVKRPRNMGAGKNSDALKEWIFERHDRYIYTDDDMEFSPNFLEYIDKTMELYDEDPKVFAVCGYSYPLPWDVSEKSNLFASATGCFMWGTGFWRDKYLPIRYPLQNGVLRKEYATGNRQVWKKKLIDTRYLDFLGLGISEEKGLLDAASDVGISTYMELYDRYAIIPVLSKARNYGFDGTGEWCQKSTAKEFNALNYAYADQVIDTECSFEPRPDTFCHEVENRKIWAAFDCRKNMKRRVFVLEMKHLLWGVLGEKGYQKLKALLKPKGNT